jgi:hypothetical protein
MMSTTRAIASTWERNHAYQRVNLRQALRAPEGPTVILYLPKKKAAEPSLRRSPAAPT